jgi:uncharacterized protein YmfQ (DUF2313 family)
MAHRVEDWHVLQQLMPRGKAWPRDQTAALTSLLRGFSSRLQLAEANADLLVTEMRPETTDLLLADWEDYLGLPDCNAIPTASTAAAMPWWRSITARAGWPPGRLSRP